MIKKIDKMNENIYLKKHLWHGTYGESKQRVWDATYSTLIADTVNELTPERERESEKTVALLTQHRNTSAIWDVSLSNSASIRTSEERPKTGLFCFVLFLLSSVLSHTEIRKKKHPWIILIRKRKHVPDEQSRRKTRELGNRLKSRTLSQRSAFLF